MSSSKTYNPQLTEGKWYAYWLENNFFQSVPDDREPYTIVLPPPNVTGVLHMGHILNCTVQDVLIRHARMKGKNACWVPGLDHASIATEAKVVAMLKERGLTKQGVGREAFLTFALEWKSKYGDIILKQLEKLGASCDWKRTRFTMEEGLSAAVTEAFIHLYQKGWIYRGTRMINWDPVSKTAISDEEVIRKEVKQKLYYIRYAIADSNGEFITIATTRPETIMADTAVCIHPADARYKHLKGKKVYIPIINRAVPIIEDSYVTMEFGTGCLKVTPAHDIKDYELGEKYQLPFIDILNEDGTLNDQAVILVGQDRFEARKNIVDMLRDASHLEKEEDYISQVGFSERTNAIIEPKLSIQWFCKMQEMAKPALDDVASGKVKFVPEKFVNIYRHWMENIKDWCISRQLWWGQRIPAWYDQTGAWVVARNAEEAIEEFMEKADTTKKFSDQEKATYKLELKNSIRQDEDVVDTWFSSWLWPISVFDGFKNPQNPDMKYYYPTNDLVTGPDILFFWVARMIMAGHEFQTKAPFKKVYLTGTVRDKLGRKMSKSLGNSPDPMDLIEKYGADGVRVGMLLCSPAGNDLLFDESYCAQGRNFANKIWNAFRLISKWKVNSQLEHSHHQVIAWFEERFQEALSEIEEHFNQYRLSDALMTAYKLVWDDFCAWYLEIVKPAYQECVDSKTYQATLSFFEKILRLLHPFMPFITEELWHEDAFEKRQNRDCCIIAAYPSLKNNPKKLSLSKEFATLKELVSSIRNFRNRSGLSHRKTLYLAVKANSEIKYANYVSIMQKLVNVSKVETIEAPIPYQSINFMVSKDEFFLYADENITDEKEQERLLKEIKYLEGFLQSVNSKLSNTRFLSNAKPEIIENEQKKRADAESKIAALKKNIT